MTKILVLEDEASIRSFIMINLKKNNFDIVETSSGEEALEKLDDTVDIALLDVMLPGISGFEVCKRAREQYPALGIIMLTAKGQEENKIEGLELGADDYITKPFGTNELLARVRATLRTSRFQGDGDRQIRKKTQIKNMTIEYEARRVTIDKQEIKLTQTEYNIIELLSVHAGRVLTYSEIIKKIWGYSDSGSIKKLQVNMANIRKKLGEQPGEYLYILNELGVGYRMNADNEEIEPV